MRKAVYDYTSPDYWQNLTWTNHLTAQVKPGANGQYVETCNGYSATSKYGLYEGTPYRDITELRWTESSSSETKSVNGEISHADPIPGWSWPASQSALIPDTDRIGWS